MFKRLSSLLVGDTLSALGIAMVVNSGLGCFAVTAANLSIASIFGISIGIAGMIVELITLLLATWQKEGIGITAIVNAVYGSLMVDFFISVIPCHPLMVLGVLILPIAWAMMGKAELGDTGTNILMNAIIKKTGKSIKLIRTIEECVFLAIGLIGARDYVTWFTLLLSVGLGYLIQVVYKLIKYDPTKMKHSFVIKRQHRERLINEA